MAVCFSDPTVEIAKEVCGESWDGPFISPPGTPFDFSPEGSGWELQAAVEENHEFHAAYSDADLIQSGTCDTDNFSQIPDQLEADLSLPPAQKRYKLCIPSRFCHFCGKKVRNRRGAACGRVISGFCRKMVCVKCLMRHNEVQGAPIGDNPDPSWVCPHCRGTCAEKAQCRIYSRINQRRNEKNRRRRSLQVQLGSGIGEEKQEQEGIL